MIESIQWISNLLQCFNHRNRVLFNCGVFLLLVCWIQKFIPFNVFRKKKWYTRSVALLRLAGILSVALSLLLGTGTGFGLGGNAGIGVGSENDSSGMNQNPVYTKDVPGSVSSPTELQIYVKTTHVFIDQVEYEDPEKLKSAILEKMSDDKKIVLINEFAENQTYSKVKDVLTELALNYDEH